MSTFHGCLRKNRDGTSRIIEKDKRCLCPTSFPYWKKQRTHPREFVLVLKNINKNLLKELISIGTVGEEVEKISRDDSRQTTQNSIL